MRTRKLIVLSVVLLLGLACNALAEINWDGGAGPDDPNWSTALNWTGIFGDPDNTVPGPATTVNAIATPSYGPTIANPGAVAGVVIVGQWGWPGQLTVTSSGDLTDAGHLIIANDPGIQGDVFNEGIIDVVGDIYIGCNGNGTLTNSGNIDTGNTVIVANNAGSTGIMTNTGDVDIDYWMYVGFNGNSGLLNIDGGTIDVPNGTLCIGAFWDGAMAGPGHVNFHGGVVTVSALTLNGGGNSTADFTEGVLLAANADADGIRWMAEQGLITAYGGTGTVMVDEYNLNPGYITVWGSPPTDVYWDGGAGAGEPNWNAAINWNTDTVPTSADAIRAIAIQPWPGYGPVIANPGAVAKRVDLGILGWNGELTLTTSGSLTVINAGGEGEGDLGVAYNDGLTGMLVNEGSIDVGGYMYIGLYGDGLLNMNDGTINVNGSFCIATLWDGTPTGIGHVNFNGGVVTAGGLISNGTGSCTADFTTGELIAGGNHASSINWLSSVNLWTAYGGWGDLNVDYSVTNPNKTTVTATPANISHPAVELTWHRYSSVSRDWDRALNWWYPATQHAVPRACDNVVISNQAIDLNSPIIEAGSSVDANYVSIGDDTFVSIATLTVAGGILDCDTLNIGTSGPAHLRLIAGTVTTADLLVNITNATIDIEEGVLILDGNQTALINNIRDEGVLTGYGDPDKVVYDYGQTNPAKTTVKAVPGQPCPVGDLSDDCVVNMEDLRIFAEQWLDVESYSGTDCANIDGVNGVNFSDFAKMANNWLETPVALPRIAAESSQPDPVFYNTQTAQEFTPLGSNYIRLQWLNDDWASDVAYHITFNTGFYDIVAAEATLAQMQQDDYNITRVFIDRGDPIHQALGQYGMAGPACTNTPELYQPCLDNLIDFLRRARNHNIYVILVCDWWPHNRYYNTLSSSDTPENVDNINITLLAQGAIDAKKLYITKLVEAVKNAEPDGALLSTVFSWEFSNEVHVTVEGKPFSMTTGTVSPADGLTYDMSDPDERQQCLDAGVIFWANQIVDAIKAVDPDAMASFSVFTYRGVGKSGPNGVLPRDAADPRFPPLPHMQLLYSTLSYVDVHLYPTGPGYPIDEDLASSLYANWDLTAKPLLMGEFGAHKYYFYPQIDNVPTQMAAHRQNAFDKGFSGALYWTWNAFSQRAYWHLLNEGGMINDALKPGN